MTRVSAGLIEEWSQWFAPCNWYDFHIFHCHFENDWKFGDFDFRFIILGIGFWVTWTYDADTEFRRQIMKQVEELGDE